MDKQSIELRELREYAEQLNNAIKQVETEIEELENNGGDPKRIEALKRELLRVKSETRDIGNIIKKESEFRQNRDIASTELTKVNTASKDVSRLLARAQDPEIIADTEEYNRTMTLLEIAYKEATGEDFDRARFDLDRQKGVSLVKRNVMHSRTKARQALDSLYGNIDQDELDANKSMIERIQDEYDGLVEKEEKFNKANTLISDYEALDDTKKAEFKVKLKEVIEKNNQIADYEEKIKESLAKIEELKNKLTKLKQEIETKQKRYEELANKGNRTPEEEKEFKKLEKELNKLNKEKGKLERLLLTEEKNVTKLKKEREDLVTQRDALVNADPLLALANIPQELALMNGDSPYRLDPDNFDPDKMDDLKNKIQEQRNKEDIDKKKGFASKNAARILEIYGVALPADGKFKDALDKGVEKIRDNYNPYHKQAGWEEVKKEPEEPKPGDDGHSSQSGEPPKGNGKPVEHGAPSGPEGTGGSQSHHGNFGGYAGNYSGPVFYNGRGSYGSGSAVHSQGSGNITPPADKPKDEKPSETPIVKEELETGNDTREAFRNGIISYDPLEHFDASLDYKQLAMQEGRRKVENGFVYRVMPIYDKGRTLEYVQVREPISEYTEDTSKKLKAEINIMIDSLKELSKEDLEEYINNSQLSPEQREQLLKATHGNFLQRSGNKKDFISDILSLPKETQVKLLIAYKTSDVFPELLLKATAQVAGNPLEGVLPSDLIMLMDAKGKDVQVVMMSKEAKTLRDSYNFKKPETRPAVRRTKTKSKEQQQEQEEELDEI